MALPLQGVPQHGPQRVLIFDDEDLGWRRAQRRRQSAQPARRNSGLARILFDIGDLLLALLDVPLHAIELGERFLTLVGDLGTLDGVIAGGGLGGQRVDTALEGYSDQV